MELLRLILNYSFWEANKGKILKEMFPKDLGNLYDLIVNTHNKLKKDLSINELKALYKAENPTATAASLSYLFEILDNVPSDISEDTAKEVLSKSWITELGRRITQAGCDIVNGETSSFKKIREILEAVEQGKFSERDEFEPLSTELEDILDAINVTTKWQFNIQPLSNVASGIGPGLFTIVFARVETGKTAFWTSLCASPNGFAHNGAIIHAYCNEEPPRRVQGRAIMSASGMSLQEILLDKEKARAAFEPIRSNLRFFECKGASIEQIDEHINRHRPDIVVFDQLDKFSIRGSFNRGDERLGALYQYAREIGDKTNSAVMALSQASANSEGKTYMSSVDLADSRTAKAAEGDLVIGIGKSKDHEDNIRILNIIKNKITGNHNEVVCRLHPQISRYTV